MLDNQGISNEMIPDKLHEIAKVYEIWAEEEVNSKHKSLLENLSKEFKKIDLNIQMVDEDGDDLLGNPEPIGALIRQNQGNKAYCGVLSFISQNKGIMTFPNKLLASMLYTEALAAEVGSKIELRGVYENEVKDKVQSVASDVLEYNLISLPTFNQELINEVKAIQNWDEYTSQNQNRNWSKEWKLMFDYSEPVPTLLLTIDRIEKALEFAYDENVRKFIDKNVVLIEEKLKEFEIAKNADGTPEKLKQHLEYTIKKCEETLEKCTPATITENAFNQLFTNHQISEKDINMIAFYVCKDLKRKGELTSVVDLEIKIENPNNAFEDLIKKIQNIAKKEEQSTGLSKVVMNIEDFFLTILYAMKYYIFRGKEQRNNIDQATKWGEFIAQTSSQQNHFLTN